MFKGKLIVLALLVFAISSQLITTPTTPTGTGSPVPLLLAAVGGASNLSPQTAWDPINRYIRSTYWYYLDGATIIHKCYINFNGTTYITYIYRNYIGSWLVIASWDTSYHIQINTFVRLGNGEQNGVPLPYGPADLAPWIAKLELPPNSCTPFGPPI